MSHKAKSANGYFTSEGTGEHQFWIFHTDQLPPHPAIILDPPLQALHARASYALGMLNVLARRSTLDVELFLESFHRSEAVYSSQIEGLKSSFSDLIQYENRSHDTAAPSDVRLVSNYVAAMHHGLDSVRSGTLPLSLRLIRELHDILLEGEARTAHIRGNFRTTQVWIGGRSPQTAAFVPQPANEVLDALSNVEAFIHTPAAQFDPLLKAAIVHAQFETIHPFLDGNGRIGRLLISLMLCSDDLIDQPFISPSLFVVQNRSGYYGALQGLREESGWTKWIEYFLTAIDCSARQAIDTLEKTEAIVQNDRSRLHGLTSSKIAERVLLAASRDVMIQPRLIATELAASHQSVMTSIGRLVSLGILDESTGGSRDRKYVYRQLLALLEDRPTSRRWD
ncbi:MAG: Fic family protein [Thermoleophilaceae bacterium]|nr:Fic family protein [Thermoleophilaceae bacterium]